MSSKNVFFSGGFELYLTLLYKTKLEMQII